MFSPKQTPPEMVIGRALSSKLSEAVAVRPIARRTPPVISIANPSSVLHAAEWNFFGASSLILRGVLFTAVHDGFDWQMDTPPVKHVNKPISMVS